MEILLDLDVYLGTNRLYIPQSFLVLVWLPASMVFYRLKRLGAGTG